MRVKKNSLGEWCLSLNQRMSQAGALPDTAALASVESPAIFLVMVGGRVASALRSSTAIIHRAPVGVTA
jgi:hypothetical protein